TRRGLFLPLAVAVFVFVVFVGLGSWQLERKAWKEGLIETLEQRSSADPVPIPSPQEWGTLSAERDEFRRVRFVATLEQDAEALVYTVGSAFRSDLSGPGYWVMAPARLADRGVVVLNRGFVPEGQQQDKAMRRASAGPITMIGAMRWPEPRGFFAPAG